MGNADKTVKLLTSIRSIVLVSFGTLGFAALVYITVDRGLRSTQAAALIFLAYYFTVRATLTTLMVYSGLKSSGKNPTALFGLNLGLAAASLFLSVINILEYLFANGDWKDAAATGLYLPAGLVIMLTTLYIRKKAGVCRSKAES